MYLHIGTSQIKEILFNHIIDSQTIYKPKGGLWFTKLINDKYSEWVEYISTHPETIIYNQLWNCGNIVCLKLLLNDDSHIFYLDSDEKLKYLIAKYHNENFFSYRALSYDYDGIFVNIDKLSNNYHLLKKLYTVNTFILFNINAIKEYYSGLITPIAFYDEYCFEDYILNFEENKKMVIPIKSTSIPILNTLKDKINSYCQNYNLSNPDDIKTYKQIEQYLISNFTEEINFLKNNEDVKETKLIRTLINNFTSQS